MRRSRTSPNSPGIQAPQAQMMRSASSTVPSSSTTRSPSGRAAAVTRRAPACTARSASARTATRACRIPASGSSSVNARSSVRTLGKRSVASTRCTGMPRRVSTRSLAASQPSSRRASHATPAGATSRGSSSRHSSSARRDMRACTSSSPCDARIRRDSSPLPERTCPGASCSTWVTSQPERARRSASDEPSTPAPTTTAEDGIGRDASATRPAVLLHAEGDPLRRRLLPRRLALVDDAHAPLALELQLRLEGEGLVGRLEAADELAPLALLVAELPLDGDLAAQRRDRADRGGGRGARHGARDLADALLADDLLALELDGRRERRLQRAGGDLGHLHVGRRRVAVLVQRGDGDRVRAEGELARALPRGEADRHVVLQAVGEVADLD